MNDKLVFGGIAVCDDGMRNSECTSGTEHSCLNIQNGPLVDKHLQRLRLKEKVDPNQRRHEANEVQYCVRRSKMSEERLSNRLEYWPAFGGCKWQRRNPG